MTALTCSPFNLCLWPGLGTKGLLSKVMAVLPIELQIWLHWQVGHSSTPRGGYPEHGTSKILRFVSELSCVCGHGDFVAGWGLG
jgi:hypothetical protein